MAESNVIPVCYVVGNDDNGYKWGIIYFAQSQKFFECIWSSTRYEKRRECVAAIVIIGGDMPIGVTNEGLNTILKKFLKKRKVTGKCNMDVINL